MINQHKIVDSTLPLIDAIKQRYSARCFSLQPLAQETINTIFEAARWAPSANNEQPWRFFYTTKDDVEKFSKLFECLSEGNKNWVNNSQVLGIAFAKRNYSKDGTPNKFATNDVSAAVAFMSLQAMHMGIYLHVIGGFLPEIIEQNFQFADDIMPVVMFCAGYPGNPDTLPDDLKAKETAKRKRKELKDLIL